MIRLIIWAGLFGSGLWFGIELHRIALDDRRLDAGGRIGPKGVCVGVMPHE